MKAGLLRTERTIALIVNPLNKREMSKLKLYEVTIAQSWSQVYKVKAETQAEAKQKAWKKFKPKKSLFKLWVDLCDW